jgi:type I restriction enzyme S subunit
MEYLRLKDVCDINMGQSPTSDSYNDAGDGVPFFQGNADFGDRYPITRKWCNAPTKMAQPGDILISVRAPIGAINYAKEECCIGRGLAAVTPDRDKVSPDFVFWFLKGKKEELNSKGTGSTFKAISRKVLEEILVPNVDLKEQSKYAEILEKIYFVQKSQKQELKYLDDLIKARFVEMFGDPTTNLKGWDEIALSKKLNVIGGYAFRSNQFDEISGIPILRIGNINAGFFKPINLVYWKEDDNLQRYAVYPGDLVMSLTGTVGKDDYGNVCILGNDYEMYYLNQRNAKLEIKEGLDKYYLSNLLKFEQIRKRLTGISRGVRQANISNKDILNLVVPVPPIELQKQFADFVRQTDKSKFSFP